MEHRPPALSNILSAVSLAPVVLMAEADRATRERFSRALEQDHFRVLSTGSIQEALAVAEAWIPDVVVTEVLMPQLDGFGLIRAVRCLYPDVPIIVTSSESSYRGRPLAATATELGVAATLMKPLNLGDLTRAVHMALPPVSARFAS